MRHARFTLTTVSTAVLLAAVTACGNSSTASSSTRGTAPAGSPKSAAPAGATTSAPGASDAALGPMNISAVKADPAVRKLLPASIKKKGTITVAMDLHYPPTSFLASDNSTAIGFNPDFARLVGKIMGLKVDIKNVTFDTIIPGLQADRYDFTATNMSATPQRLKVLDMINYWTDGSSLLVAKGNPEHLAASSPSMCGRHIAVTSGTTQALTYLPRISKQCKAAGKQPVSAVTLPNVQTALTQLNSHRIDGVFYDTPQLAWAAAQQPTLFELVKPQYKKVGGTDQVAVGLKKGSALTPAMHAAIQAAINGPYYKKALNRWGLGAGAIATSTIAK